LAITYVGHIAQEIEVGSRSVIDILMAVDAKQLSEIVVTAVGIERNAKELSYSVTTVGSEELTDSRQNSVLGALQGKIPGAQIQTASGAPGASQKILLRGIATFTNGSGQPLIIIDGIPMNNGQLGTFDGQTSLGDAGAFSEVTDAGNGISTLEPENIKSVSVLKGIAAAALYGSAAANGAIIITTKDGKSAAAKGRSEITFSSSYMMDTPLRLPKVQTEFGLGQYGENQFFINDQETWGDPYDGTSRPFSQIVADQQLWKDYSPTPQSLRNAFDTGHSMKNTITFAGGNETANFFASYSYLDQKGTVPYTGLDRHNIKLTGGSSLKNNVTIRGSIEFTKTIQDGSPQGFGGNADAGFYGNLLRTSADLNTTEARNFNDPFWNVAGYFTPFNSNPFRAAATREDLTDWNRVNGFVEVGYDPFEFLNFKVRAGADYSNRELEQYRPIEVAGPPNNISRPGVIRVTNAATASINLDAITTFNKEMSEDLNLSVILGLNVRDGKSESTIAMQPNLGIGGFRSLNNGLVQPVVAQGFAQRRLVGVYSQVALGYKGAYHLELQGRNDWSSTLPVDNNSFFYWSAAGNVIISELVDLGPVSFLKASLSYAQVGNDAPAYSTGNAFSVTLDPNINSQRAAAFPFGGFTGARAANTVGNSTLKPEKTSGYELGIEVGALNERINFALSYYNQLSADQIQNVTVPGTTGFTSRTLNAGSIRNKGLEMTLTGVPIETDDFTWKAIVNFTKNSNTIEELAPGLKELPLGGFSSGGASMSIIGVPGSPFGLFQYTDYIKDPNGNLVVDPNGRPQFNTDENVSDGRSIQPDYTMAFLSTLTYKNFSLSFNFQTQNGGYFFSQTYAELTTPGKSLITAYNYRSPWIVPGSVLENADGTFSPNTSVFVTDPNQYWNNQGLEEFLLSASYIKLREMTLSYNLPMSILKSTPFRSIVVSAVGSNLFLWTPKENVYADPEQSLGFGIGQGSSVPGYEYAVIPSFRSYGFSLRATL
jgi:TonB-linked SusC/RagA family outer membrane protein